MHLANFHGFNPFAKCILDSGKVDAYTRHR